MRLIKIYEDLAKGNNAVNVFKCFGFARALTVSFTAHCCNSHFSFKYLYVTAMEASGDLLLRFLSHLSYILARVARSNSLFNLVCNSWFYYKISANLMTVDLFAAELRKWQPIFL